MNEPRLHRIPARDPISGQDLFVSELSSMDGQVQIRGKFEIPKLARLEPEQYAFLETFIRCRGMINSVEKELGISYPTARARLDSLLEALNLSPVAERKRKDGVSIEERRKILEELEQGSITPEEAKEKLKGAHA